MSPHIAQPDAVLCHCLGVTASTVRDCVMLLGAESPREVKESCGAGGGCMACRQRIQCCIDQLRSESNRSRIS